VGGVGVGEATAAWVGQDRARRAVARVWVVRRSSAPRRLTSVRPRRTRGRGSPAARSWLGGHRSSWRRARWRRGRSRSRPATISLFAPHCNGALERCHRSKTRGCAGRMLRTRRPLRREGTQRVRTTGARVRAALRAAVLPGVPGGRSGSGSRLFCTAGCRIGTPATGALPAGGHRSTKLARHRVTRVNGIYGAQARAGSKGQSVRRRRKR